VVSVLQGTRPIEVLLVEDDLGDIELTKEAIEEAKLAITLNVVRDGNEAMAYLRGEGAHANAAKTDLILLDLNMPRKDGREVLRDMRNDPHLAHIPVVVLTTSDADEDISNSYDLGANCYVTKPVGLEQFIKVVQTIRDFWFMLVELPGRE
jgi:chemotaxis family two-component system response regulator Rcp1